MASGRRLSAGRSPLVRKQSQITYFFSPGSSGGGPSATSKSPEDTPNTTSNPNPSSDASPSQLEPKKPRLFIPSPIAPYPGKTPPLAAAKEKGLGAEVIGRRIKVFWPLDNVWYVGRVQSFDELSEKHVIHYDDGEDEALSLANEKFEWVEAALVEEVERPSRRRRLRRLSGSLEADNSTRDSVILESAEAPSKELERPSRCRRLRRLSCSLEADNSPHDSEILELAEEAPSKEVDRPSRQRRLRQLSNRSEADNSTRDVEVEESTDDDDNEWNINRGKDEDDDDLEELELEEEDDDEVVASSRKSGSWRSTSSMKRKKVDIGKLDCSKRIKFDVSLDKDNKTIRSLSRKSNATFEAPVKIERGPVLNTIDCNLSGEVAERFGKREADKFRFLWERRKDGHGRLLGDENYDPRTLYLPQEFLRSLSGGQRQWWEFKSKHMDKVIFFKMGKFYELFEMDAHIGAKELDLQYMKGEQPHCGFPEKNFSMYLEKLARKGYRVLVVEQTETPEQLELRRKKMGSKDKVVKREICAVVTKGTLTEGESLLTDPNISYLLSITEHSQDLRNQSESHVTVGLCLVDVSTSKFMVGQFEDDLERHCLCSILSELRPVEIIKPLKSLSPETEKAIKDNTRNPLINDLLPLEEFWDADKAISEIKKYYNLQGNLPISDDGGSSSDTDDTGKSSMQLPDLLIKLINSHSCGSYALSALGGCLFYLRQAFLDQALLRCAKFEPLPCFGFVAGPRESHMILDAAALENLEILENNRNGGHSGTLFAQLDHCVTAFGKRLLKGWLARPLYDINSIVERQEALAYFKGGGQASALEFRKELSRLPDMERLLSRLFSSCEANGRNARKVILYEDAAKKQVQEFVVTLRGCEVMVKACLSLSNTLSNTESILLRHLLTPGKRLSDMSLIIERFKNAFDWSEADCTGLIIPDEGCDIEYDASCKRVKEIESSLMWYLKEQHKVLGDATINYVTVGKDSYLLEIPESLSGAVPREYELQSSKKGYFRYWTPKIKEYLVELSQADAEKESNLKGILQRLISQFSEQHGRWRQLLSVISELDVLISLAIASDYYEGATCRPLFKVASNSGDAAPYLSAKGLGHPILQTDALGRGSFVPNDIDIGASAEARFILLTGPNMGGKSTLLRQVCLAVILAQIGADVPSESFELSPVDRIFVRMGAKDQIMTGQSTFLVELSETASVLSSATRFSLVALDELGRGTSTSDGQAIAASVFEYLVHTVQCRGLFSTHYHRLAVDYEKDTKVSLCHMACQVGGVGGVEEVTFLYRLMPGSCPKSYGVNVARLAGLPTPVLENAARRSRDFELKYGKSHAGKNRKVSSISNHEKIAVVREVLSIADGWEMHLESKVINMNLLTNIQKRVKLLVTGK